MPNGEVEFRSALNVPSSWEAQCLVAKFVTDGLKKEAGVFESCKFTLDISTAPSISNRSAIFLKVVSLGGYEIDMEFANDSERRVLVIRSKIFTYWGRVSRFIAAVFGVFTIIASVFILKRDAPLILCIVFGVVIGAILNGIGLCIAYWIDTDRINTTHSRLLEFFERNRIQIERIAEGAIG